eukprot:152528-Pyramimonas_sp.AAC.1
MPIATRGDGSSSSRGLPRARLSALLCLMCNCICIAMRGHALDSHHFLGPLGVNDKLHIGLQETIAPMR